MAGKLFFDFETRSEVNIKSAGAFRYARDPSTSHILLSYALDDEPVQVVETFNTPIPAAVLKHVADGKECIAWNIDFDREIWNADTTIPEMRIEQCTDAMAMASAMAMPRALGAFTDMYAPEEMAKLGTGSALIRRFCIAGTGTGVLSDIISSTPYYWADFKNYAEQDTGALRWAYNYMNKLSPTELRNMRLDMKVNLEGIPLDMAALEQAEKRAECAVRESVFVCTAITGSSPTQPQALTAWINNKLAASSDTRYLCMGDMQAGTVAKRLEHRDILPADVVTVLECRQICSKTSVAKLKAMRASNVNGYVHGALAYHVATTGRAGGRIIQPQNMPRPSISQEEIEALFDVGFAHASMNDLSSCLRGIIAAPLGEDLTGADLANIEGRMLAWLAGEEWKLQAFREYDSGIGEDIYKIAAAGIYKCEVAELQPGARHIGKTAELACGYQGGVGAFTAMAKTLGVVIGDAQAKKIVEAWREKHTMTTRFWKAMESKAALVVRYKKPMRVNSKISFRMDGDNLMMRLPSGRELCYPDARMEQREMPWGGMKSLVTFWGKNTVGNTWSRQSTYGGKLTENATQGASRDLLYDAMHDMHEAGHPIHMHVHDEVISSGGISVEDLCGFLTAPRSWTEGLPLAAEGWKGRRFRK